MGKCLFVVGASSDMGLAAIRRMEGSYDRIVAHYRTDNPSLNACAEALGDKIRLVQADLAQQEELEQMLLALRQEGMVPDHILHFPAPLCHNNQFRKIKWEVFQREWDISLRSFVRVCQTFLPLMAKAQGGRVVTVLSNVINGAAPKYCANYVITKYALYGAVKALAAEYADKRITVNAISPDWVDTKYLSSQPDLLIQQHAASNPLGRNLTVDEVTPAIEFLLSDGSARINGQSITISSGGGN